MKLNIAEAQKFFLELKLTAEEAAIADKVLLATEFRDVTTVDDPDWIMEECDGVEPLTDYHIASWAPAFAESMFLARFEELTA